MYNQIINTPWKFVNEIKRLIISPYIYILFKFNNITWGKNWRFFGTPIIQKHHRSRMQFGSNICLRSTVSSNPLGTNHPVILCTWRSGALLQIGDNFGMTGGSICAAERVIIGNNVGIGANCIIMDTDFHPLDSKNRLQSPQAGETSPVIIEDEVFIGMNCIILKGVTIGAKSVVGAGSVVTHDIPPYVIVAGNPAKVIRNL